MFEMTNPHNQDAMRERLTREAPQLCFVLNEDISQGGLIRIVQHYYVYEPWIASEGRHRYVLLAGVYRQETYDADLSEEEQEVYDNLTGGMFSPEVFDNALVHSAGLVLSDMPDAQRELLAGAFEVVKVRMDEGERWVLRTCWHSVVAPYEDGGQTDGS